LTTLIWHITTIRTQSSTAIWSTSNLIFIVNIYWTNLWFSWISESLKTNDWNSYQKLNKINAFELKPAFFASTFLQEQSRQNSLVSLASVKRRIYNPLLPSLRKMSRDDVLGKLSHEHSRHTTTLSLSKLIAAFKCWLVEIWLTDSIFEGDFDDESLYLNVAQGQPLQDHVLLLN